MSTLCRRLLRSELPRRLLASVSIGLVLLLSVLASSPDLHRAFHHDGDSGHEDGCAVVLFAHGVSTTINTAILAATPTEWLTLSRPASIEIFLTSSRYLHPPERGPPVS
ncbi:MAG: hypothetical protein ABI222_03840 [Opitutaceae bacterium]